MRTLWNVWWVALLFPVALVACGDTDKTGTTHPEMPREEPSVEPSVEPMAEPTAEPETPEPLGVCPQGYPLRFFSGKSVVDVVLNGVSYAFIYDTGAPTTTLDVQVAAELGTGTHRLETAGQTLELRQYSTANISTSFPGISGILGSDLVADFSITLDYQRGLFWMEPELDTSALEACEHVVGDVAEIEFQQENYLFVQGTMEGLEGWYILDSGASLGGVPEPVFSQLQQVRERNALQGFYTPAFVGTFWALLSSVREMETGGLTVQNLEIRTLPVDLLYHPSFLEPDEQILGLLPSGFLSNYLVSVDFPNKRLRLAAYSSQTPIDPTRFYPLGFGLAETTEGPVEVEQVLPGSSAEEQGVLLGDIVRSIDGYSMENLTPSQRPWRTVSNTEFTRIEVVVERDGEQLAFELEARDLLR